MADASDFTKMVPGFDFLQGLVKNAGAALPGIGQWVAPTLNPEELDKRIEELRTVQFWLEQNARMLGATIQALEVQRMTLSTLQRMNVSMGELREAMTATPAPAAPEVASADEAAPAPSDAPAPRRRSPAKASEKAPAPGVVDPMQWWGALTQQFSELAAQAMKDERLDEARHLAGTMMQQGLQALKVPATAATTKTPPKTPPKAPSKAQPKAAAKTAARPRRPAAKRSSR